ALIEEPGRRTPSLKLLLRSLGRWVRRRTMSASLAAVTWRGTGGGGHDPCLKARKMYLSPNQGGNWWCFSAGLGFNRLIPFLFNLQIWKRVELAFSDMLHRRHSMWASG